VPEVLIADDEPTMLKTLSLVLQQQGLEIATATTGREVLVQLCRKYGAGEKYDALILDLKMPDIDGWQVMQALQANPLWKDLPVVVISGFAHGARDYANITRFNGVLVEKKEDFTRVVTAVLERVLDAGKREAAALTQPAQPA
jgi:CheY-like chemotaxis protein